MNNLQSNTTRNDNSQSETITIEPINSNNPFEPPGEYKYDLDSPPSYDTVERIKKTEIY
jgi:hypothetical protein